MSRVARRLCGLLLSGVVATACGGSTSKSISPTTSATGSGAPSTSAGSPGGALTVSGSLSLSLAQSANVATPCKLPTTGSTTAGGLEGNTSGTLSFNDGTTYYALQFSVGAGTTTFPAGAVTNIVGFYPSTDSTKEWSIGTNVSKAERGTVTLTGKHGTIDVDMAPDPPQPNPALKPIHVKGTFECP